MATITPSTPLPTTETVKVPATGSVIPGLAVGDIVRLTVRDSPNQGQGLILWNGVLVPASLPPGTLNGERLVARLIGSGEQLLLQVLSRELPNAASAKPSQLLNRIASGLEELLKNIPPPTLGAAQPTALQHTSKVTALLGQEIDSFVASLGSPEQLGDTKAALQHLHDAATGGLAGQLRAGAQALQQFIGRLTPDIRVADPFLTQLAELSRFLQSDTVPNSQHLAHLTAALDHETKTDGHITKLLSRESLQHLRSALASDPSNVTELRRALEPLLPRFMEIQDIEAKRGVVTDLERLAGRLEQLANLQETLNRLNPVMQALGEPAVILFPFLFQGLLFHGEVSVNDRGEDSKNNPESETDSSKRQPFQRIQIAVPLPSLGPIGVDLAVRPGELLLKLTLQDDEARDFIESQLSSLRGILQDHGFSRADLSTEIGVVKTPDAVWRDELRNHTSVIA